MMAGAFFIVFMLSDWLRGRPDKCDFGVFMRVNPMHHALNINQQSTNSQR